MSKKKNPLQKNPLQRQTNDGKLVCPGCNLTLAIREISGVTNDEGIQFHNKDCRSNYEEIERKSREKHRPAQTKPSLTVNA